MIERIPFMLMGFPKHEYFFFQEPARSPLFVSRATADPKHALGQGKTGFLRHGARYANKKFQR